MYATGRGVEKDEKEAVKWYTKAAEQNDSSAQNNLGVMYSKGQGVTQDYIQAHKWFNIAGMNGSEVAAKNRDALAKRMALAQVAEAQKLAREWMESHKK